MAKESGLGMTVGIDDSGDTLRQIENDITSIQFGTPQGLQDITGLDKSGMERLILLSDGTVTVNGVFNDASGASIFDVFKTRTGIRDVTIIISGQTLTMKMLISDVAWDRASDGAFTVTATLLLQSGTVPVWS